MRTLPRKSANWLRSRDAIITDLHVWRIGPQAHAVGAPQKTIMSKEMLGGNAPGWCRKDPYGLIDLFGGEEKFSKKLDSLFVIEEGVVGDDAS